MDIISVTGSLGRLLPALSAVLLLGAALILASCQQKGNETPASSTKTPTSKPTPIPIVTATVPVVLTDVSPATLLPDDPIPSTPTAEPPSIMEAETPVLPTSTPGPDIPGALIKVSMESQVGVLLDELPADIRDQFVVDILDQPDDYWMARALRQVRLTRNRLNFRNFIYDDKGQLPLPPEELWSIRLDDAGPIRQTIQGHDLVMVGYTFTGTLLSDTESPGQAEQALEEVGGTWQEPFVLPADPGLLLQRTGNACVNEGGFPPNSFDSENMWIFYDYACEADSGGAVGCHRTRLPNLSCREALEESVGEVEASVRFERIGWDSALAAVVRVGSIDIADSTDLKVVGEDLDTNRIVYRYIDPENCALAEGSVGGSGWRRLLQFSATVYNIGGQPLDIGPVVAEDLVNHVFSYNPCHDHFHYSNYGDFSLETPDKSQSSKQAFCVQSTSRLSNNEITPLTHNYSCRLQGIQAGWVDEYVAGLDSQWIDITDLDIPASGRTLQLAFTSNSDRFLCEGTTVVDEDGDVLWEPSGFTTGDGSSINRPQCDFVTDWEANNRATHELFISKSGSFITAPCSNWEFSPLRNCGFEELPDNKLDCMPGESIERTFRLEDRRALQVLRVCERSALLESGVACTAKDSLSNSIIGSNSTEVNFFCPSIRDAEESMGGYALYTAPIWPEDAPQGIIPAEG